VSTIEYRASAVKVTTKDEDVYITSSVEGGLTVKLKIGLAQLALAITAMQEKLRESK
jgi:hypothetical protein